MCIHNFFYRFNPRITPGIVILRIKVYYLNATFRIFSKIVERRLDNQISARANITSEFSTTNARNSNRLDPKYVCFFERGSNALAELASGVVSGFVCRSFFPPGTDRVDYVESRQFACTCHCCIPTLYLSVLQNIQIALAHYGTSAFCHYRPCNSRAMSQPPIGCINNRVRLVFRQTAIGHNNSAAGPLHTKTDVGLVAVLWSGFLAWFDVFCFGFNVVMRKVVWDIFRADGAVLVVGTLALLVFPFLLVVGNAVGSTQFLDVSFFV